MKVDPNWTETEAAAALAEWFYDSTDFPQGYIDSEKQEYVPYEDDPTQTPYEQWLSATYVDMLRDEYIPGETNGVVLRALCICFFFELPVPRWLQSQFWMDYVDVSDFKYGSWEDVWGKPQRQKGYQKSQIKRREEFEMVAPVVEELHKGGEPFGVILWDMVAEKTGVKPGQAHDVYYDFKKRFFDFFEYKKLCRYISEKY